MSESPPPPISGLITRAASWRPASAPASAGGGFDAELARGALRIIGSLLPAVRRPGDDAVAPGTRWGREHHLRVGVHTSIKLEEDREDRVRFAIIDARSTGSCQTVVHGMIDAWWRVPERTEFVDLLMLLTAALKGALERDRGDAAVARLRAAAIRRLASSDLDQVEMVSATPWSGGRASDMMIDPDQPPNLIGCVGPCRAPRVTEVSVASTVGGAHVTMRPVTVSVAREGLDPMEVLRALGPRR